MAREKTPAAAPSAEDEKKRIENEKKDLKKKQKDQKKEAKRRTRGTVWLPSVLPF